jgi:hypothetical protein
MKIHIASIISFALLVMPSLKAKEETLSLDRTKKQTSNEKKFENFLVSATTAYNEDGKAIPPYLLITEQRFIGGEVIMPYACFTGKVAEDLMATLLVGHTSTINVSGKQVTIIRCIYQFKPPSKKYIIRRESFKHLKDPYPFPGFFIDTDGQQINGDIGPPP